MRSTRYCDIVAASGRRTTTHTEEPFSARNIAACPGRVASADDDHRRADARRASSSVAA
jgi:hypothetical protein